MNSEHDSQEQPSRSFDSTQTLRLTVNHPVPSLNALFSMHFRERSKERHKIAVAMLSALQATEAACAIPTIFAENTSSIVSDTPASSPTTRLRSWITASASRKPKKARKGQRSP